MTKEESGEIYNLLVQELENLGYGWVVAQVREEISNGKIEKKEVKVPKEIAAKLPFEDKNPQYSQLSFLPEEDNFSKLSITAQKGNKASLLTSIEYSPEESLRLLIEAVERVFLDIPEMENKLKGFLEENDLNGPIIFYNDNEENDLVTKIFSDSNNLINNDRLRNLLNELRRETYDR